jgi:glutathione synthase/RimK-type ligase-like ATP-grasp enzyme
VRVALATCRELPHLDADEAPLLDALRARGVEPVLVPWDGDGADAVFASCACTVIRSTWDYTRRVDAFVAWAQRLEAARVKLWNSASVVRWNTHKRYLVELARDGLPVVPTVLVPAGSTVELRALLTAHGAVVKPAVSAGSRDTVRVTNGDVREAQALLDRNLPREDMLVQPFLSAVEEGELSLHYVDGVFTHAVNKVPKRGDFRSQPEFDSTVTRVEPSPAQRRVADDVVAHVGGNLLYARVDLVAGLLMELEVVEPSMYLRWAPDAATAFADAIVKRARA